MRHIHVGDVGTIYRAPIDAADINIDPATATTRQMIISLPNDVIITKDLDGGSPPDGEVTFDGPTQKPSRWFFTYTVQPDSGPGSPPDFHAAEGDVSVQVHLEGPDGVWSSDVFTGQLDDLVLHVYPNLS